MDVDAALREAEAWLAALPPDVNAAMTATYRFGRFELRPATRQLLVDQQPAALGARAFDLLLALIERRDQLVTKNDLLELVWPGLVVEENNLQVQVSALRKLLGQDAIATVAGRGYRFTLEPAQVETPAPSPVRVARDNLPAQVASFIGRERELIDLRAMLANHRLVTLVGIGGIGKTRLALQLAAGVVDAHADGVWFVDLAPISDPRLVVNAIAATLGVREEPGRPIIETLRQFVEDRTLLLVLDNCEHLLLACAQLARDLLQAGRKLTIVATSREPLHVSGEVTFPLATLPRPDPAARSRARRVARVCRGAAVSRPRDRRSSGLRLDARECRGRRAHLPRPRRHPAGARTGRGAGALRCRPRRSPRT